jgi:alpha-tubulin suppressor-like RCC1 family protein
VAGGSSHSLAVTGGGDVYAWGWNEYGQVGDGTHQTEKPTPVQVKGEGGVGTLTGVVSVSAGDPHSVALKSDGSAWAWGHNAYGELGDGGTTDRYTPVQVSSLTGVTAVSAGGAHSLAVKTNNAPCLSCGMNGAGQLGDGTNTERHVPVQISGLGHVVAFAGGNYHSLALTSDGKVWAWGGNNYGQLGDGYSSPTNTPAQVKGEGGVGFLTNVVAVAAGWCHNLALTSDGKVWAWGYNHCGELGNGESGSGSYRSTPVQVKGEGGVGTLTGVVAVAGGFEHSLALKSNGEVWAWGLNDYGQLGDGTINTSIYPVQTSVTGAVAVAGCSNNSLAVKGDGSAWAWGSNRWGQLGNGGGGEGVYSSTPAQVKGLAGSGYLTGVVSVAAGSDHSLALKGNGQVWAWGSNFYGQLGDNTTADKHTPVQVKGPGGSGNLTGVAAVTSGFNHNLAVKGDGSAWGWGDNDNGQLGDNTITKRLAPVQVKGLNGSGLLKCVLAVAAGYHSLFRTWEPTITALSFTSGTVGSAITVSGSNFGSPQGTSYVKFGTVKATSYTSWDDNKIVVKVPQGAGGIAAVTVMTTGGTSNSVTFKVVPKITSASPMSGTVGTSVTIKGNAFRIFQGTSYVMFGSVKATSYIWSSDTMIVVKVPSGAYKACNLVVHTPGGNSNAVTFKVIPKITSISSTAGKIGSTLTIKGTAFCPARYSTCYVTFGADKVSTYYSWSNTKIAVKVPSTWYGMHYVRVTTSGGTSTGLSFTVKR